MNRHNSALDICVMKTRLVILSLAVLWPAVAAADAFSASDAPRGQPGVERAAPAEPRTATRPVTTEPVRPQPMQTARPGQGPRDVPGTPSGPSNPPAPAADDDSMRFELVREGPAASCGSRCRTWVSAIGPITNDTPKAFETFMQGRNLRGMVVALHSPGGSVAGGLELGNLIRRAGMNTTVAKTTLLPGTDEPRGTLSANANCASMCTFVLLGGVRRAVSAEAKVLVHQIWPSAKRDDPTAQNYTADNIVGVQRSLGVMAKYTVEMGGDIELFEMSMRIPPWERMKQLTADELRRTKLHNVENVFDAPVASLTPAPSPIAAPVPPTVSNLSPVPAFSSPAPSNGWTLIEKPGLRGLARRHPITVEGEQIGNFEIMFACSATPENYSVRYVETRRASVSERLKSIVLSAGPTQIPMAIESSSARASANGLETIASGTITAKLLAAYGEVRGRAIQVATESTGATSTAIRLANTGLAPSLPQLAAACGRA
jgi:hypothetical protein